MTEISPNDLDYFIAQRRAHAAQLRASNDPAKIQYAAAIEARMIEYETGTRQLDPLPKLATTPTRRTRK